MPFICVCVCVCVCEHSNSHQPHHREEEDPTYMYVHYIPPLNKISTATAANDTHKLLAMLTLGRFLEGVHKECVRDLLSALERPINPEGAPTPHLFGPWVGVRGHRYPIRLLQSCAVVGDLVGTLLVVVLVATCERPL